MNPVAVSFAGWEFPTPQSMQQATRSRASIDMSSRGKNGVGYVLIRQLAPPQPGAPDESFRGFGAGDHAWEIEARSPTRVGDLRRENKGPRPHPANSPFASRT